MCGHSACTGPVIWNSRGLETARYLLYNLSFATASKSNNSGNVHLSSEKFSPRGDVRIHKVSSSIRAEDAETSDGRGLMLSTDRVLENASSSRP